MKRKLLLIFPVDKSCIRFQAQAPPLSLGIIAALTPTNWDIEIIDENWEDFVYKEADLVGITSWTFYINRAYKIAGQYKKAGIPVVMGGMHVSAVPHEAINYCNSVVVGIAEEIWPKVIHDFENGNLKQFYHGQPTRIFIKPRRDLFDNRYMWGVLQTSRGCPMSCEFCSITQFHGNRYIKRPIEEVIDDINEIQQKFLFIVDENILGFTKRDEEKTLDLFIKMSQNTDKKYWYGFSSINIAYDNELLKKASDSGCGMLFIGIESEDEDALKSMNKKVNQKISLSEYDNLIKKFHKNGIGVFAGMIYCAETDRVSSINKRAKFIHNSKFDAIHSSILTPFPGTKMFERMKDTERLIKNNYPEDWKYYNWKSIVVKPDFEVDFESYTKDVQKGILSVYKPYRIILRAIKTYIWTKSLTIAIHGFSSNINYRDYFLNKTNSRLKRIHNFLSTKIFKNFR